MTNTYEIEVKSLLGSKENSDKLLQKLREADANFKKVDYQVQLNHYFSGKVSDDFLEVIKGVISAREHSELLSLLEKADSTSIRTREKNGKVLLIVKGATGSTSSVHGHQRLELEAVVDMPIDELDNILIENGLIVQAKWSADRTFYKFRDITIDMIFSPGYGYMVEFEKVVEGDSDTDAARTEILETMAEFGVVEFDPNKLERMFEHYNNNWQQYYGTDKVFTIE